MRENPGWLGTRISELSNFVSARIKFIKKAGVFPGSL
jgi:hypothetical protein